MRPLALRMIPPHNGIGFMIVSYSLTWVLETPSSAQVLVSSSLSISIPVLYQDCDQHPLTWSDHGKGRR